VKPVKFSPEALADLEALGEYIGFENPSRARSYVDEIYRRALNVGSAPRAYPKRDDLRPDLRMAVHGPYLILFRIGDEYVEIARIIHGARDLPRALDE
jgi:toxin ParE1/3/4